MKTRHASLLILAAALSASALIPLSAASHNDPAIGFPVTTVTVNQGRDEIQRGTTSMTVLRLMGATHQELSPDVWVYRHFQADNLDLANDQGCDALVITFVQGKVADLKLVNQSAVTAIAANMKVRSAEVYAVKK
jgi:hypothetical protein